MAELTVEDVLRRLHRSVEPCYHCQAQLMILQFFELAADLEKRWPNAPLSIHRDALELICWPDRLEEVLRRSANETTKFLIHGQMLMWLLRVQLILPEHIDALKGPVAKLLYEIFQGSMSQDSIIEDSALEEA